MTAAADPAAVAGRQGDGGGSCGAPFLGRTATWPRAQSENGPKRASMAPLLSAQALPSGKAVSPPSSTSLRYISTVAARGVSSSSTSMCAPAPAPSWSLICSSGRAVLTSSLPYVHDRPLPRAPPSWSDLQL